MAVVNHQFINQHVDVRQRDHAGLVRDIVARGTVLLKNEGSLPSNELRFMVVLIGSETGPNSKGTNRCDRLCKWCFR